MLFENTLLIFFLSNGLSETILPTNFLKNYNQPINQPKKIRITINHELHKFYFISQTFFLHKIQKTEKYRK